MANQETSYFNASQLQIQRLNLLWQYAIENRLDFNIPKYRSVLLAVYLELCADMSDDDNRKCKELQKSISGVNNMKVKLENPRKYNITDEENDNRITSRQKELKLYNKLLQYEVLLKKIEKKQGKGMKYRDDDGQEDVEE